MFATKMAYLVPYIFRTKLNPFDVYHLSIGDEAFGKNYLAVRWTQGLASRRLTTAAARYGNPPASCRSIVLSMPLNMVAQ